MLTGLATRNQTPTAVMEEARKAGKALDVGVVIGAGASGSQVLQSGGLKDLIGGLQLEVVGASGTGTGMMMIPVGGDLDCHQKWLAETVSLSFSSCFHLWASLSSLTEGKHMWTLHKLLKIKILFQGRQ